MIDSVRAGSAASLHHISAASSAALQPNSGTNAAKAEPSAVAMIAARGVPINAALVSAVRAAIAEGRYPVDPDAIAARMMASDLPTKIA